ncbi:hypothetical protein BGX31_004855, partial [Mortierella sp. GBA43]
MNGSSCWSWQAQENRMNFIFGSLFLTGGGPKLTTSAIDLHDLGSFISYGPDQFA